jgi:hypothetical protein
VSYESAVDAAIAMLNAGQMVDEAQLVKEHDVTPYGAGKAREHAEDRVWGLRQTPKPTRSVRQTHAWHNYQAKEKADRDAAALPRSKEQRG